MLNFTLGVWANPEDNVSKGQLYVWCLIYYFAAHTWWRSFMRWCNRAGSLSRVIGLRHRSWRLEWMNWRNWNWKKLANTTKKHTCTLIKLFQFSWKEYLHINYIVLKYKNHMGENPGVKINTNLEDNSLITSHKNSFICLRCHSANATSPRHRRTWTTGYTTGPISFGPLQLENEDTEGGPGRHNQQWA